MTSLKKRMAEVERRVIIEYWNGTNSDAGHFKSCRLCGWTWRYGEPEQHEATCPMREDMKP